MQNNLRTRRAWKTIKGGPFEGEANLEGFVGAGVLISLPIDKAGVFPVRKAFLLDIELVEHDSCFLALRFCNYPPTLPPSKVKWSVPYVD